MAEVGWRRPQGEVGLDDRSGAMVSMSWLGGNQASVIFGQAQ
jgi:hypothetical protein